jgi:hypothetical protein
MKRKPTITERAFENERKRAELAELIDKVFPELDAFVREKFRDDPAKIAEWEESMRIDPPPKRRAARADPPSHRSKG